MAASAKVITLTRLHAQQRSLQGKRRPKNPALGWVLLGFVYTSLFIAAVGAGSVLTLLAFSAMGFSHD